MDKYICNKPNFLHEELTFKFYQVQQLFNAGLLDIFDNDYKKAEKNFVEAEKLTPMNGLLKRKNGLNGSVYTNSQYIKTTI